MNFFFLRQNSWLVNERRGLVEIFRTKEWTVLDIGLLKWASIFFGMILGAFFSGFIRHNIWYFIFLVVILAIKPLVSYWKNWFVQNTFSQAGSLPDNSYHNKTISTLLRFSFFKAPKGEVYWASLADSCFTIVLLKISIAIPFSKCSNCRFKKSFFAD